MSRILKHKASKINVEKTNSNSKLTFKKKKSSNANGELRNSKLTNIGNSGGNRTTLAVAQKPIKIGMKKSISEHTPSNVTLKETEPRKMKSNMHLDENKLPANQKMDHKKTLKNMAKRKFDNPDEPHRITYDDQFTFDANEEIGDSIAQVGKPPKPPNTFSKPTTAVPLTYYDSLVLNVLHTKVLAHANGFSANNLPSWYEQTFGKTLPNNWLDLLKCSQKFSIANLPNKLIIFAQEEIEESSEHGKNDLAVKTKLYGTEHGSCFI